MCSRMGHGGWGCLWCVAERPIPQPLRVQRRQQADDGRPGPVRIDGGARAARRRRRHDRPAEPDAQTAAGNRQQVHGFADLPRTPAQPRLVEHHRIPPRPPRQRDRRIARGGLAACVSRGVSAGLAGLAELAGLTGSAGRPGAAGPDGQAGESGIHREDGIAPGSGGDGHQDTPIACGRAVGRARDRCCWSWRRSRAVRARSSVSRPPAARAAGVSSRSVRSMSSPMPRAESR